MKFCYKLLAFVLCLGMIFALAACQKQQKPQNQPSQTEETAETPVEEPIEEPVEEPAEPSVDGETFRNAFSGQNRLSTLVSETMLDVDATAETSFRVDLNAVSYMGEGSRSISLARDGNKLFVLYKGMEIYALLNPEDGSADICYSGFWMHVNDLGAALEGFGFGSAFGSLQTTVSAFDNPFSGCLFSIDDFTYDAKTGTFRANSPVALPLDAEAEDQVIYEDLEVKIEGTKLVSLSCKTMIDGEYQPILYRFEYDEDGNLTKTICDQMFHLNGTDMRMLVEIGFSYDEEGRLNALTAIGKQSYQEEYTTVFSGDLTIAYGISIELPAK